MGRFGWLENAQILEIADARFFQVGQLAGSADTDGQGVAPLLGPLLNARDDVDQKRMPVVGGWRMRRVVAGVHLIALAGGRLAG